MFYYGDNRVRYFDDFRPEIHDSDGLLVHTGADEWIWRPLTHDGVLQVSSLLDENPRGFGLMQRDRDFKRYEDLEAHYERRPSAWVEPRGQWGAGRVELVQIPSPDETNDNIVAYWVPKSLPKPKEPFDFAYRVLWQMEGETKPPGAWVTQTRRGRGYVKKPDESIGFMIDFAGENLKKLAPDAMLEGVVTAGDNGKVLEHEAYRNEVTGGVRLALRVRRIDSNKPVELRAFLRSGGETLSETWTYALPPG
jgi:glucans biosynthesis protein